MSGTLKNPIRNQCGLYCVTYVVSLLIWMASSIKPEDTIKNYSADYKNTLSFPYSISGQEEPKRESALIPVL